MVKTRNGITIISLVITIIVLILLSTVSIVTFFGDNSFFSKTNNAKTEAEIKSEKKAINAAIVAAKMLDAKKELTKENFNNALNKNIGTKKFDLQSSEGNFFVTFKKSERNYKISMNGDISLVDEVTIVAKDKTPGDYKRDANGKVLYGSEELPYELSSVEDIIAFGIDGRKDHNLFKDKKIILTRDIDFNSEHSYADSNNTSLFKDYNRDGKEQGIMQEVTNKYYTGYQPIEDFRGIFDGQNHTITNIYIQNNKDDYIGFIDDLNEDSIIRNLTVEGDLKFICDDFEFNNRRVGGLVGRVPAEDNNTEHCATIENCVSKMNIEVDIKNCIMNTTISSYPTFYIGGLVGNNEGNVYNCESHGYVHIKYNANKTDAESVYASYYVGGMAGKNAGEIKNSINYGEVKYELNKITENFKNSSDKVGGIAGYNVKSDTLSIKNCINVGNVEAKTDEGLKIAGIVGESEEVTDKTKNIIENAYNLGDVTAEFLIGSSGQSLKIAGIAADCYSNLEYCYNTSNVQHNEPEGKITSYIGTIVGDVHSSAAYYKNCKYLKVSNLKGLEGRTDTADIEGLTVLTKENVIDEMNTNIENHNKNTPNDWIKWEVVSDNIILKK